MNKNGKITNKKNLKLQIAEEIVLLQNDKTGKNKNEQKSGQNVNQKIKSRDNWEL